MIAYLDSSVVLRVVLGQPGSLREWRAIEIGVASALLEVECVRTLDRLRLLEGIAEDEIARRRETVYRIVEALTLIEPTRPVLARAAQPLPVVLGTLDALHLASMEFLRSRNQNLTLASYDDRMITAAQAIGFELAVL